METVYEVALKRDKILSVADFPAGSVLSIQSVGPGSVRLAVAGDGASTEKIPLGLKDLIYCYQRIATGSRIHRPVAK
jgi:hypothetical protein